MKSVRIPALNSKKENIALILVIVTIMFLAYSLIQLTTNQEEKQEIFEYQISAYEDLSNVNNSFYTDLTNALMDIQALYETEGKIPEIHSLEEEGISPFVRDSLWENRGALEWKILKKHGKTYYLGISQDINLVGNFLIEFQEDDLDQSKIYFNQEHDDGRALVHSLDHIHQHWKEILAYTGEEERKKF